MFSPALSLESILAAMTCLCSSTDNGANNLVQQIGREVNMKYPNESMAIVKPGEITEIKERLNDLEVTLAEIKKLQLTVLKTINSREDTYNLYDTCPNNKKKEKIKLRLLSTINVLCEEFANSPWIVIQHRFDGSIDFNQPWHLYQQGFGDFEGEFFIGLEKLHILTSSKPQELLVEMENVEGGKIYAHYDSIIIGNANESYALKDVGKFEGTFDFFSGKLNRKFSTYNQDNDDMPNENCALSYGAWWHSTCLASLNGRYNRGNYWDKFGRGMSWSKAIAGPNYSVRAVKIMLRDKIEKAT